MAALAKTFAALKPRKWDGKQIGMPGIYSGIPLDAYHAGNICVEPSISSSGLRKMWSESPAHYWVSSVYNENRIETNDTDALLLGQAFHFLLFGEKRFNEQYIARPATINGQTFTANSTIYKVWKKARENEGLTIITLDQLEYIKGMANSLSEHAVVRAGILNGVIEHSLFHKDARTGIWLKARPDCIPNQSMDYADLKTCRSVIDHHLVRTIDTHGYNLQAGLLSWIARETIAPINSFSFVFVENRPPYCVRIKTLKENEIERGERQCRAMLKVFAECMKAKHWPGPGGDQHDAEYIELDERTQKYIDERLTALEKD
jgi:hypothetical protein